MQPANVAITSTGPTAVVEFIRPCISDADAIAEASHQIADFIARQHPHHVVFDFSQVKFFSSQVLGLLLEARAQLRETHGQVLVKIANPQLRRVFKITNLERIFQFVPPCQSIPESSVS